MTTHLTLYDWAKRRDPRGSAAAIAMILSQTNEILTDMVMAEGNLPTGHRCTIATGLPTVYYRSLNEGIPVSRGTTVQVDEGCAIAEARSEVDIDLAMLEGDQAAFRLQEAQLFLEAMNQQIATGMFYGNPANNDAEFLGLAPRYSDTTAGNAQNIISMGGSSALAQTSIWLINWGVNSCFSMFPRGSNAGLYQQDLGQQTAFEFGSPAFAGRRLEVLAERFQWKIGMVVKDWRSVARIANIETDDFADLGAGSGGQLDPASGNYGDLLHGMARAVAKIPKQVRGMTRPAFYMNASVFSALMRTGLEKSNSAVTVQPALTQFGDPYQMLSFMGIPIRQCDAIVNTEAVI